MVSEEDFLSVSYYESMRAIDPQGLGQFGPHGIDWLMVSENCSKVFPIYCIRELYAAMAARVPIQSAPKL